MCTFDFHPPFFFFFPLLFAEVLICMSVNIFKECVYKMLIAIFFCFFLKKQKKQKKNDNVQCRVRYSRLFLL